MSLDQSPPGTYRAGLLIPSSNTFIEPEYYALMPRQVSMHFARLRMTSLSDEGIREQDRDIAAQARLLGTARVHTILFCQTAASFHLGRDWDRALRQRLEDAAGCPALTAAGTVVTALRALGVDRVALATPFPAAVSATSRAYLEAESFQVVATEGLGITDNFAIASLDAQTVLDLVRRADCSDAQAILVPGGNMPCLALAGQLESELGKPVVTTNQAGIWSLCRQLGVASNIPGHGRLLAAEPGSESMGSRVKT